MAADQMLCVANEHVGEPGLRVDFIELGADNQAVHGGSTLAATIGLPSRCSIAARKA